MTESILLPGGILLATVALAVLAAVSLVGSAPSALAARPLGVPAQLPCPITAGMARVRIGVDRATHRLSVVWCERFTDRAITCDRGCIPPEPLEAVA